MGNLSLTFAIDFGIPALLIVFAFFTGTIVERRHFRRIIDRENELRGIPAFAIRRIPKDLALSHPKLVYGSAVISVDYFKKFAASLRAIIGGRLGTYESLFERARREAMLRMKDEARRQGGDIVLNVKFETVRIFSGGGGAVSVEAMAYGTAYRKNHAGAEIH
jgi:uncharacterized protein YbjQ (UPF0145 family)